MKRYGWNPYKLYPGDQVEYLGSWDFLAIDGQCPDQILGIVLGLAEDGDAFRDADVQNWPDDNFTGEVYEIQFDCDEDSRVAYEGQLRKLS